MSLDPTRNFALVGVSTGYAAGATSVALASGEGSKLPDPATEGAFNLVWWNSTDYASPTSDPNREVVRCTARTADALTVTRAQEGTADTSKNEGGKEYKMVLAVTKKTIDDINAFIASLGTMSTQAAGAVVITGGAISGTKVTKRVGSATSHATPTINTDSVDAYSITALAEAITSMTTNLSGTPTNFQPLIIRIKDNGTARAISWGASFENAGYPLPATTILGKLMTVGLIYNSVTSKWGCVSVANES